MEQKNTYFYLIEGKIIVFNAIQNCVLCAPGSRPSQEAVLLLAVGCLSLLYRGLLVRLLPLRLLSRVCEDLWAVHHSLALPVSKIRTTNPSVFGVCLCRYPC